MNWLSLFQIQLGVLMIVFLRAVIRARRRFDFAVWQRNDGPRVLLSLTLSFLVWIVLQLDPDSLEFLTVFGLNLSSSSATIIGFAIGGFALWIPKGGRNESQNSE